MKKRTKIVIILSALVLLVGAIGIFSFAFESDTTRDDYLPGHFLYYDASKEKVTPLTNDKLYATLVSIDNGDVIKLLSDASLPSTVTISSTDKTDVGEVDKYYIDLNGYELVLRYKKDDSSPYMLDPHLDSEMYIYTSYNEDTARICACSDHSKKTSIFNPRYENAKIYMCSAKGMPIIQNGSNEVTTFKLAEGENYNYVNTFAPVLLNTYINLNGTFNPLKTSLTIEGGYHYQIDVAAPLFSLASGVDIYASNAKFISLTGSNIISGSRNSNPVLKQDSNGNDIYVYSASGDSTIVMNNCLLYTDGLISSNLYEAKAEPDRLVGDSYIKFNECTFIGSEVQTILKGEPEYINCSFGPSFVTGYGQTLIRDHKRIEIPVYGFEKRVETDGVYVDTTQLDVKVAYIDYKTLAKGDETVEITWIDNEKNVIKETWLKSKDTVPTPPPVNEVNELYTFVYSPKPVSTDQIDKTAIYEAVTSINFGIMSNMLLQSDITFNLYVPEWAGNSALMKSARIDTLDEYGNVIETGAPFAIKDSCEIVEIELAANYTERYYVIRTKIPAHIGDTNYRLVFEMGEGVNSATYNRDFSIFDYADRVIEGNYTQSAKSLVLSAKTYIKSAVNYFVESGTYTGPDIAGVVGAAGDGEVVSGYSVESCKLFSSIFKSATFLPDTTIKFRFIFNADAQGEVTFHYYEYGVRMQKTVNIDAVEDTIVRDGVEYKYVVLPIFAVDLREKVYIDIAANGEGIDYHYCLANYVHSINNNEALKSDTDLHTLVDAMWAYSEAAEAYIESSGKETPTVSLSIANKVITPETHAIIGGDEGSLERAAAEALRKAILAKTGLNLSVFATEDEAAEGQNLIFIRNERPAKNYDFRAAVNGENLVISSFPSFIEKGISMFIAECVSPHNKDYDFTESFCADYFTDKIYYSDFGIKGLDVDAIIDQSIMQIIDKLAEKDAITQITNELSQHESTVNEAAAAYAAQKIEEAAEKQAIKEANGNSAKYETLKAKYLKEYTENEQNKSTYKNEFIELHRATIENYKAEYSAAHKEEYKAVYLAEYQLEENKNALKEKYKNTDLWHTDALLGIKEAVTIDDTLGAISEAHKHANLTQRHTICADDGAVYYFNTLNLGTKNQIAISCPVDFGTATFMLDDSELTEGSSTPVFIVKSSVSTITITDAELLKNLTDAGVGPDTKKLDLGLGYKAMVVVVNNEAKVYRRRGYEKSWKGTAQQELVIIDENGNIDPSTPFMFDYTRLDSITVYNIESAEILIKGGTATTIAPTIDKDISVGRGFQVSRPNVVVDGLVHKVIGELDNAWEQNHLIIDGANRDGASYSGFFNAKNTANVTFKNCTLQARRQYANGSTYELVILLSNNVTFENCNQSNFYVDKVTHLPVTDKTTDTILSMSAGACWGAGNSNFCKNLTYLNSSISRFDAHQGLYNGNIIGCDIQGIEIIGFGDFIIQDTNIYKYGSGNGAGNALIHLRSDYGRTWCGTITFKDVDVYHYETGAADGTYPTAEHPEYTGPASYLLDNGYRNWYYGYTCYVPNVVVDGIEYYSHIQTKGLPEEEHVPLSPEVVGAIHIFNQDYKKCPNLHLDDTGVTVRDTAHMAFYANYQILDEDNDGYVDHSTTFFPEGTTTIYYTPSNGYTYLTAKSGAVAITIEPGKGIAMSQFDGRAIENGIVTYSTANLNKLVPPESIMILNNTKGYDFGTNLTNYLNVTTMFDNTLMIEGITNADGSIEITKEYNNPKDHYYGSSWETDENSHWHECYVCGDKKDIASHSYDNACDAICDDCGYARVAPHVYGSIVHNEKGHWYECSACGNKTDPVPHTYDNVCDAICNDCDYERKAAHAFEKTFSYDATGHWYECSKCNGRTNVFSHDYTDDCDAMCDDCGYERTPSHYYETSFTYDANGHWYECSVCGDKKGVTEHAFDNACDVDCNGGCGYVREITHDHSKTEFDATSHWLECSVCGDKKDVKAHSFDNACDTDCNDGCGYVREITHDYSKTEFDATSHWLECSVCGDKKGVKAHSFDNACDTDCNDCDYVREITHDHSKTEFDTTNHWLECSVCGDKKDVKAHSFDHACDTDCNDGCGYVREITHDYSKTEFDTTNHWLECSVCGDKKDVKAHSFDHACDTDCNDCDYVREITHDYSKTEFDTTNHWLECSVCGDKKDVKAHSFDNACDTDCNDGCGYVREITHSPESTLSHDETSHWYECSVCGDRMDVKAHSFDHACDVDCNDGCGYAREITHDYKTGIDATSHWLECSVCGDKKDEADHIYDDEHDNVCDDCGFIIKKDYDAPFVPYN